jgi:NhaP-type Na+/H+ or K+/H+ antiporter
MASAADDPQSGAPDRVGLVLVALILVAAVANLNLSVANVALPSIGKGILAVLLGAVIVYFCFRSMEREETLLAEYHAADTEPAAAPDVPAGPPQPTPA